MMLAPTLEIYPPTRILFGDAEHAEKFQTILRRTQNRRLPKM
jgi:hypothetical protein